MVKKPAQSIYRGSVSNEVVSLDFVWVSDLIEKDFFAFLLVLIPSLRHAFSRSSQSCCYNFFVSPDCVDTRSVDIFRCFCSYYPVAFSFANNELTCQAGWIPFNQHCYHFSGDFNFWCRARIHRRMCKHLPHQILARLQFRDWFCLTFTKTFSLWLDFTLTFSLTLIAHGDTQWTC